MEGKKRGQFYLVGAIVIITLLVGFSVVSNYSRNKEVVRLYDLKQELGIESARVLEYGTTYQTISGDELQELLADFSEDYADYAGEGKNLYFVFGNINKVTAIAYEDLSEEDDSVVTIKLKQGRHTIEEKTLGGEDYVDGQAIVFDEIPTNGDIRIVVHIAEEDYPFRLRTGENFYFVIEQVIGEEKYVVSG